MCANKTRDYAPLSSSSVNRPTRFPLFFGWNKNLSTSLPDREGFDFDIRLFSHQRVVWETTPSTAYIHLPLVEKMPREPHLPSNFWLINSRKRASHWHRVYWGREDARTIMDYRSRERLIGNRISVGVKIHQILLSSMHARRDKLLSLFYPYPLSLPSPFPRSRVGRCTLIVIARLLTRIPSPRRTCSFFVQTWPSFSKDYRKSVFGRKPALERMP